MEEIGEAVVESVFSMHPAVSVLESFALGFEAA